jgi:hypothetical protein
MRKLLALFATCGPAAAFILVGGSALAEDLKDFLVSTEQCIKLDSPLVRVANCTTVVAVGTGVGSGLLQWKTEPKENVYIAREPPAIFDRRGKPVRPSIVLGSKANIRPPDGPFVEHAPITFDLESKNGKWDNIPLLKTVSRQMGDKPEIDIERTIIGITNSKLGSVTRVASVVAVIAGTIAFELGAHEASGKTSAFSPVARDPEN